MARQTARSGLLGVNNCYKTDKVDKREREGDAIMGLSLEDAYALEKKHFNSCC